MAKKTVTPMMAQYNDIKAENKDKILFFRLGDFYEMFDSDALEVSRLLNLTLTHRAKQPMCGIPYHAAKTYIKRLLDEGKKIAICEQMELSTDNKSIAKRKVVQVITPATVVDDDFLNSRESSYLLCLKLDKKFIRVAYSDITSGEFCLKSIECDSEYNSLRSFLLSLSPKEILAHEDDYFVYPKYAHILNETNAMVTPLSAQHFQKRAAFKILCNRVEVTNLRMFGIEDKEPTIGAAGALMYYLEQTAMSSLNQITGYTLKSDINSLKIDASSLRSLEILQNTQDGGKGHTLYATIDKTLTSGGARLLKKWLSNPLINEEKLLARQNWVAFFKQNTEERERVRTCLSGVLDLVRLTTRITMKRNSPADLLGISRTAQSFFSLVTHDWDTYGQLVDGSILEEGERDIVSSISEEGLQDLLQLVEEINRAIQENVEGLFQEGKVIRDGYDSKLDELRKIKNGSSKVLNAYLARVKEEMGIDKVKLGQNRIIGHYIEISKANSSKVLPSFIRKQTLVNAERYTSVELSELDRQINQGSFASEEREKQVYKALVEKVAAKQDLLLSLGNTLSRIDVLQGLATIAQEMNYCQPQFTKEDSIDIVKGRHAVVEKQLGPGNFVSNDLQFTKDGKRFALITGPNMAGKSTYLRQCALIIVLAQIGSFVPAERCTLSLVDKLFCRVGASDNLARGESTFMVEMQEAAHILRTATRKSFVIMDEIGRGTSTQDGMSLASAFMSHLVALGSKTLFATHYHELTTYDTSSVLLKTLKVEEQGKSIIFVRKVVDGIATSSYGLHVAKMAGVPAKILREASRFQTKYFGSYSSGSMDMDLFSSFMLDEMEKKEKQKEGSDDPLLTLSPVVEEVENFDLDRATPMQAMMFIQKLKDEIEEGKEVKK